MALLQVGVLQAGKVVFEPELPPWKWQAIRALGMGSEAKVTMHQALAIWSEFVHSPLGERWLVLTFRFPRANFIHIDFMLYI